MSGLVETLVRVVVSAEVRSLGSSARDVISRELGRGLDLIANAAREDSGVVQWSIEECDGRTAQVDLVVAADADIAERDLLHFAQGCARRGLSSICNLGREDVGLLRYGLSGTAVLGVVQAPAFR